MNYIYSCVIKAVSNLHIIWLKIYELLLFCSKNDNYSPLCVMLPAINRAQNDASILGKALEGKIWHPHICSPFHAVYQHDLYKIGGLE